MPRMDDATEFPMDADEEIEKSSFYEEENEGRVLNTSNWEKSDAFLNNVTPQIR